MSLQAAVLFAMLAAAVAPTSVEGRWRTPDYDGEVRLQRCSGDLCGRLVTSTLIAANPDLRDLKNADPSLRGRPLKGLEFVTGLKGGPGVWTDGTVYNPDDGRTYSAELRLIDADHVQLRGCVVFPLCKTEIWNRIP